MKAMDYFDAASQPLVPILFLSVVDHHLRTKAWCQPDGSEENRQRERALQWIRATLLRDVKMSGDGAKGTLGAWIRSVVVAPMKGEAGLIWKYPVEGFVLMLGVAAEEGVELEVRTRAVWRRLLHHVTARYVAELGQTDEMRMRAKVDSVLGAMGEGGWVDMLMEGRFRPVARGEVEALERLNDEWDWVKGVCGPAMGKWLGFLKELVGGRGRGTVECIWEVKGRWGAEAECVMERPEDVVEWW